MINLDALLSCKRRGMWGFTCPRYGVGMVAADFTAARANRLPVRPAVPSLCPIAALDDTIPVIPSRNTEEIPPISMGSPKTVPVPWQDTDEMSPGVSPAFAIVVWMSKVCDGPFGAVKPLDFPA
jgi:hypothetical protein